MNDNKKYISLLSKTDNTRDLGEGKNAEGKTRKCRILRSDVPGELSDSDIRFLKDIGVNTVIDLRDEDAVQSRKSAFDGLDGFKYVRCTVEEGSKAPETAEEVAGIYLSIAKSSGIRAAIKAIAAAPEGVLYNCTAGKDRTGVLSAILLMLSGLTNEDVVKDYMLTMDYSGHIIEWLRQNWDGFTEVAVPVPEYMQDFIRLFDKEYGSIDNYMAQIGITLQEQENIIHKLCK